MLLRLKQTAGLGTFSGGFTPEQLAKLNAKPHRAGFVSLDDGPEIREAAKLYVDTWVMPLIDELLRDGKKKTP